ncbi:hypothetical protein NXT3_PB00230 (plasmid) [Sinorhizobium fredii]|uniref:Uncharacterized protein n=1 Tax=Rhizobium fredii TaxID=380 RepID=A0A2L0HDR4_RHIFR|nr:hypothetical protein NXT3_PB00230 [Sinorhizobium fredii]
MTGARSHGLDGPCFGPPGPCVTVTHPGWFISKHTVLLMLIAKSRLKNSVDNAMKSVQQQEAMSPRIVRLPVSA